MVLLLIAYDIDHLINGVLVEAHLRRTDILRDVYRGAIRAEEDLTVKTFVSEVGPYRSVRILDELAFLQTTQDFFLTEEVGLRLVVDLVEANAHTLVGLVEASIDPGVHHAPEAADLFIAILPAAEHSASVSHQRRSCFSFFLGLAFVHESRKLGLVVLVKENVEVADQVVTLLPRALGRRTITPALPSEHGLTDVDPAVVDDVGLEDAVA